MASDTSLLKHFVFRPKNCNEACRFSRNNEWS